MVAVQITSVTDNPRERCVTGGSSAHPIGSTSAVLHLATATSAYHPTRTTPTICDQTTDHFVSFDPRSTTYAASNCKVRKRHVKWPEGLSAFAATWFPGEFEISDTGDIATRPSQARLAT